VQLKRAQRQRIANHYMTPPQLPLHDRCLSVPPKMDFLRCIGAQLLLEWGAAAHVAGRGGCSSGAHRLLYRGVAAARAGRSGCSSGVQRLL
jgi:hypothetical protein